MHRHMSDVHYLLYALPAYPSIYLFDLNSVTNTILSDLFLSIIYKNLSIYLFTNPPMTYEHTCESTCLWNLDLESIEFIYIFVFSIFLFYSILLVYLPVSLSVCLSASLSACRYL